MHLLGKAFPLLLWVRCCPHVGRHCLSAGAGQAPGVPAQGLSSAGDSPVLLPSLPAHTPRSALSCLHGSPAAAQTAPLTPRCTVSSVTLEC